MALMGYAPANWNEKKFTDAVDHIVAVAKQHGKKIGILATSGDAAKGMKDRFDFIAIGADARTLIAWYRKELEVAKS